MTWRSLPWSAGRCAKANPRIAARSGSRPSARPGTGDQWTAVVKVHPRAITSATGRPTVVTSANSSTTGRRLAERAVGRRRNRAQAPITTSAAATTATGNARPSPTAPATWRAHAAPALTTTAGSQAATFQPSIDEYVWYDVSAPGGRTFRDSSHAATGSHAVRITHGAPPPIRPAPKSAANTLIT